MSEQRPIPPGAWQQVVDGVRERNRPTGALLDPPTALARWEADGALVIHIPRALKDILDRQPVKMTILAEEIANVFGCDAFPRTEVLEQNPQARTATTAPPLNDFPPTPPDGGATGASGAAIEAIEAYAGLPATEALPGTGDGGGRRSPFERIKRSRPDGAEYWSSRDLAEVLGYDDYRNFENAVVRAKRSCENSGHDVLDHFVEATDMIETGKGAKRRVDVVQMSRYASYLAIQNADSKKPMVALGQTYFALQTRLQELADQDLEDSRRVLARKEMAVHNRKLAAAAKEAGVVTPLDYAIFQDHGYKGLYGGLNSDDIHGAKGLTKSQKILDHMGSTELAANLFRATQTEEKLRRDRVRGKDRANKVHQDVGAKVRQTIGELGGTMPEDLPAVESIKKVERRLGKGGTGELAK